jgi:hypothetical protein
VHLIVFNTMVKTNHQWICDLVDIFVLNFYDQNLELKRSVWIAIIPFFKKIISIIGGVHLLLMSRHRNIAKNHIGLSI